MEGKRRPGLAFWAAVIVVPLIFYPLSLGPYLWLDDTLQAAVSGDAADAFSALGVIYEPLNWAYERSPRSIRAATQTYLSLWIGPDRLDAP